MILVIKLVKQVMNDQSSMGKSLYIIMGVNTKVNHRYSRSQNNVNVVYYNYKEITSNYSELTEHNLLHSMLNVGIMFKIFV